MSDDQALEELVARGESLSVDTSNLSATIERLTLKNEELQQDLLKVSDALQDAHLRFEAELLDKDLKTTQIETELATLQLNVARAPDSSAQVQELQSAVSELTIWHADVQARLAVAEKSLETKTKLLEHRNASVKELTVVLGETTALCDVLQESQKISDQLIETFELLHTNLEKDNSRLKREKQELQDALTQSISVLTTERNNMRDQMEKSEKAKEALEIRIKKMEPQLLPKWEKTLADRNAKKIVSLGTHQLARDYSDLNELAASQAAVAVASLADSELSKQILSIISTYADICRLALLSKALCRYLVDDHLSAWIEEVEANGQALYKDRVLIAWTHQTLKDLGDLIFNAGELLRWARDGDLKGEIILEMEEVAQGDETLAASIKSAVAGLSTIVRSFLNFTMSTALTTQPLAATTQRLVTFLRSRGHDFPSLNRSPDERSSVSVPVMTLLLSRLLATIVCALVSKPDEQLNPVVKDRLIGCFRRTLEIFKPRLDLPVFAEFKREGTLLNLSVLAEATEKSQCIPLLKGLRRLEEVIEIADKTEVWSMPNIAEIDSGYRLGEALQEDCLREIGDGIDRASEANETCTHKQAVILCVEVKTRIEAISRATTLKPIRSKNDLPSDADAILSGVLTQQGNAENVALLEAKIQSYKLREDAFKKSEETKTRITAELQKLRKANATVSNKATSLEKRLNESQKSMRELQATLQEMRSAQEAQSLIPPSVASFELLKAKAVLSRMQTSLIQLTSQHAEKDWSAVLSVLDKDSKPVTAGPSLHLAEVLSLREAAVGLALRNPALELLSSKTIKKGKQIPIQTLLEAQAEMKHDLFTLARKWHKMNLDATDLIKNEAKTAKLIRDTTELTLIARKKSDRDARIVVDPSQLTDTLTSMLISL